MYWLRRPPYLRWALAALLLVVAIVAEFAPTAEVPYPFAATDLTAGSYPDEGDVEWRPVPAGMLPTPRLDGPVAVDVDVGDPLVPGVIGRTRPLPAGWWTVPLPLDPSAVPGSEVRVVVLEPPATVPGVVATAGRDDGFTLRPIGLVAVPEEDVDLVALAAARNDVMVVTRP